MSNLEKLIQDTASKLAWPKSNQEKILEKIAADLVLVVPEDLPELAKLHDCFLHLDEAINDESAPTSIVTKKCADFIEMIVLKDIEGQYGLSQISKAITGLQYIIRDLRDPSEITFPEDLAPLTDDQEREIDKKEAGGRKPAKSKASLSDAETVEEKHEDLKGLIINLKESDTELLGEFINEGNEHCATAEEMLMELEADSENKDAIDSIFRSFHTIKGAAGFLEVKPISVLSHESETLLDMARKKEITVSGKAADLIFESIDVMRSLLKGVGIAMKSGDEYDGTEIVSSLVKRLRKLIADPKSNIETADEEAPRLGEVLVDMGAVTETEVKEALREKAAPKEKIGETLIRQGKVNDRAVDHALREQQRAKKDTAVKEMVKIDTERLDRLVDTIGELVIAESMVGQDEEILEKASTKMTKNISHLNKITRELQEMGMAMRLVPVKSTFQKLARAVRDLSRRSGKKVNLELIGEEVEVDRSIVENIGDPLMHMVRNSVDHGLETPEIRKANGKTEVGNIWIRAFHKGGNIYFEIEDDGQGLDKEKILAKAVDKGLISGGKELSDKEIYNLILQAGFSTASKVTDISGRGVGMDVVRRNVDVMRGHLEIDSKLGRGSKFSMKLPLTLAIIDGMLVCVGNEEYIIPTLSVVESLKLTDDIINTVNEKCEMIDLRGEMLPLFRVRDLFDLPSSNEPGADSTVVIIDDMERRVGLSVDKLLGQRQTVIKSLGSMFEKQKWISGGAILSDGSIGLIIDVGGIIKLSQSVDVYSAGRVRGDIEPSVPESAVNDSDEIVLGNADTATENADDQTSENSNLEAGGVREAITVEIGESLA